MSKPPLKFTRPFSRRAAMRAAAVLSLSMPAILRAESGKAEAAVDVAHAEIWRRFIDRQGVMLDFTDAAGKVSLPTPEECRLGQPNALGWWSPIENGAMFNGLYLDAAVCRWRVTNDDEDADKVRLLARGLLRLAACSKVKGFVGRGFSTDGKSHYPMGSNDQTGPWFYGLWRYWESGLAPASEQKEVAAKLVETGEIIAAAQWRMPAEEPFHFRGGFGGFSWESSPRQLFVAKLLHRLTRDEKWNRFYLGALRESGGRENLTRLAVCERGMIFEHGGRHSWTASVPVAMLRGLWELERDETLRAAFARGLHAGAKLAMESLPLGMQFDHGDRRKFEADWRVMNQWWKPQTTEQEAQTLAEMQLREFGKLSPRRGQETQFVREPAFAAWIATLAPDKAALNERSAEIERLIAHYHCEQLHYSQFFPVESAWWRMRLAGV